MQGKWTTVVMVVGCLACTSQAALTSLGDFSVSSLEPPTNGYTGGGIAFIPGGTDSITQDSLVINWREQDTINTSKYNQVFQRITIPASGGTPTVLAKATLRWDMLYSGTNQFGVPSYRGSELVFDAASKKILWQAQPSDGGMRTFWFDLFSADTTIGSVGYSAKNGDNAAQYMAKTLAATPDGKITTFYKFGTDWRKASFSLADGNDAAITRVNTPISSFTGWWPDSSQFAYTVDTNDCEVVVPYGNSMLLTHNFKNSANGNALETHLMLVDGALDANAINNAVDLGNMTPATSTYTNLTAYGMTLNGSTAYVHYAYLNDVARDNRILMITVPEPLTLSLLGLSLAGMFYKRQRV